MDLSAFIVVILFTLLFFGFIVWMAIYSRRAGSRALPSNDAETGLRNE
jgi:hypothetical protein